MSFQRKQDILTQAISSIEPGNFPLITHIDQLRDKVSHLSEINFNVNEFGFTTVCYAISTGETFTGLNKEWARECRGIVFGPDGSLVSRPLHKFFNVGELPETQDHLILGDWKQGGLTRLMDKRDGSMLHPIKLGDQIILKTKKSFTSDVALMATSFMDTDAPQVKELSEFCIQNSWTPIFEFTSPTNQIVLCYPKASLTLLHIRDNHTGEYFAYELICAIAELFGVAVVDHPAIGSFEEMKDIIHNATDIEGFVLTFGKGKFVKWKTDWYFSVHHMVTFQRVRDVAEMVANETVDDLKSFYAASNDLARVAKVEQIEHKVLELIRATKTQIEILAGEIAETIKLKSRKEAVAEHSHKQWFNYAIKTMEGREVDYSELFKKHMLKQLFSLEQI